MEQAQILFPDNIIAFQPRPDGGRPRDTSRRHLDGDGLAQRLRRDVDRHIAHRRRMLAHLENTRNVKCKSSIATSMDPSMDR